MARKVGPHRRAGWREPPGNSAKRNGYLASQPGRGTGGLTPPRSPARCMMFFLSALVMAVVLIAPASAQAPKTGKDLGFEVPPGFEVNLYADDALATDIFALTIDAKGRVVVAGKDYIKILHDTTGKGVADKATLFSNKPKSGAHGMYWDGNHLLANGDGGVRWYYDTDGDGVCDKIGDILVPTRNDSEHAANGIRMGPDGYFYMITGNDAGINETHITSPRSPIRDKVQGGVVVRFSGDGKTREILAHGFRNPYDFDFNKYGHMFTVDADGERVHQMPYYCPTRLYDIQIGGNHGWITPGWQGGWSRPSYWPDVVERLVEIGRGSPTGVVCYRHRAFPKKYRDGVFSACWTFGRIYFFPLTPKGASYESKMEVFMKTTGDVGFAPTGMAVGPDGDLFIAIGGRGTRGGVFRVRYVGKKEKEVEPTDELRHVLNTPQPLASWSRAKWKPLAVKLGKKAFEGNLDIEGLTESERIRAIEILTEFFGGVTPSTKEGFEIWPTNEDDFWARFAWSLTRFSTRIKTLDLALDSVGEKVRVERAGWESLLSWPRSPMLYEANPIESWDKCLRQSDHRARFLAQLAAKGIGRSFFENHGTENTPGRVALYKAWLDFVDKGVAKDFSRVATEILSKNNDPLLRLDVVRHLQLILGDIHLDKGADRNFLGYVAAKRSNLTSEKRAEIATRLVKTFPAYQCEHLDFEIARTLALLSEDVAGAAEQVSYGLNAKAPAQSDIHYLMCLAKIPGTRSPGATKRIADAICRLHAKLESQGQKPTDQVPDILEAMTKSLVSHDANLADAIVDNLAFGHPGHVLFLGALHAKPQAAGVRRIVKAIAKLDEDAARAAWSPELVRFVGNLPVDEALPILRPWSGDPRLADAIALVLAVHRRSEDRSRFVAALDSTQAKVVKAAADSLAVVAQKAEPAEIGRAVRAIRRLDQQKADKETLASLDKLLAGGTALPGGEKDPGHRWASWFVKTHPKVAETIPGLTNASLATWSQRLAKLDWNQGDAKRGEVVFEKQNCFRCHGTQRRLGPDLAGIAQRFSRDDLFTAILDPSKDISPAYAPTMAVTNAGKMYHGMVIYQSPGLLMLQTTPDTTVRLTGEEVQNVQTGNISFMPTGLLDTASDRDLTDLYEYLKTVRKK